MWSLLVTASDILLFNMSIFVSQAKLRATWEGLVYAISSLQANKMILEGNSKILNLWLPIRSELSKAYLPLLAIARGLITRCSCCLFRHLYMNDWLDNILCGWAYWWYGLICTYAARLSCHLHGLIMLDNYGGIFILKLLNKASFNPKKKKKNLVVRIFF